MNLKGILKALKLNESTISMVLGALVILVIGVLVVNYFRNLETGQIPEESGTLVEEQPQIVRGQGTVTYTVAAGETLWSIAEKQYGSGYNWVDIASENNLTNPGVIETNQELAIPDVEPKQPTTTQVVETPEELEPIFGATYTVLDGDNLWDISVRAYGDGYRWSDIASENELVNPNIIHAGNILTLPR